MSIQSKAISRQLLTAEQLWDFRLELRPKWSRVQT